MRSSRLCVAVFIGWLFSLAIHGQVTSPESKDETLKRTTVRGKLVYEDTGNPLRRVVFRLIGVDALYTNGGTGFADDEGKFEIKNVPFGEYFVEVFQPGIVNPDRVKDKDSPFFQKVRVFSEEPVEIDLTAKRGGAISGKITFSDGTPASGVKVTLENSRKEKKDVGTDDRGVYRFAGLNQGSYKVKIYQPLVNTGKEGGSWRRTKYAASDGANIETYYPGTNSAKAEKIQVGFGQERTGIDFSFAKFELGWLSGRVFAKDSNKPLQGVKVRFVSTGGNAENVVGGWADSSTAVTDKEGSWRLNELPEGDYLLIFEPRETTKDGETSYSMRHLPAKVEIGVEEELDISLPFASRIKGVVRTGEIFAGATPNNYQSLDLLQVQNETTSYSNAKFLSAKQEKDEKSTGLDFVFDFKNLEAGIHRFRLAGITKKGFWIEKILVNGKQVESVDLKEGETIEGVELYLSDKVGTVVVSTDEPRDFENTILVLLSEDKRDTFFAPGTEAEVSEVLKWTKKVKPGSYQAFVVESAFFDWLRKNKKPLEEVLTNGVDVVVAEGEEIRVDVPLTKLSDVN